MTLVLRERFIGAKIIRAFDNSKKERDKFNDVAQEYTDNYIIINKKFALLSPMAFALNVCCYNFNNLLWCYESLK